MYAAFFAGCRRARLDAPAAKPVNEEPSKCKELKAKEPPNWATAGCVGRCSGGELAIRIIPALVLAFAWCG